MNRQQTINQIVDSLPRYAKGITKEGQHRITLKNGNTTVLEKLHDKELFWLANILY